MAKVKDTRNSFERYLDRKLKDPEFRKLHERYKEELIRKIQDEFNKRKAKTTS